MPPVFHILLRRQIRSPIHFDAVNGTLTLQLKSAISLGQLQGNLDVNVGTSGSYSVTSGAGLKVNEVQSTTSALLKGQTVTLNDAVTTSGTMTILATGASDTGITETGNFITAGTAHHWPGQPKPFFFNYPEH